MTSRRIALVSGLLSASLVTPLAAQGLGDTAAREREKRAAQAKAKQDAAKVFTNEDLDRVRPPEGYGTAAAGSPGGTLTEESAPSTVVDRGAELRPFIDAVASAQAVRVTHSSRQTRCESVIQTVS